MDVAVLAVSADKDFNSFGMLAARDYWFDSWLRRKAVNTVMNLIPIDRKSNNKKLSVEDSQALCNAFMSYEVIEKSYFVFLKEPEEKLVKFCLLRMELRGFQLA